MHFQAASTSNGWAPSVATEIVTTPSSRPPAFMVKNGPALLVIQASGARSGTSGRLLTDSWRSRRCRLRRVGHAVHAEKDPHPWGGSAGYSADAGAKEGSRAVRQSAASACKAGRGLFADARVSVRGRCDRGRCDQAGRRGSSARLVPAVGHISAGSLVCRVGWSCAARSSHMSWSGVWRSVAACSSIAYTSRRRIRYALPTRPAFSFPLSIHERTVCGVTLNWAATCWTLRMSSSAIVGLREIALVVVC